MIQRDFFEGGDKSLEVVFYPPVAALKGYSPYAKKFYWDGKRFGVVAPRLALDGGAIIWFSYYEKRNTWLPASSGKPLCEQPEKYTEHLFKDSVNARFIVGAL